MVLKSFSFHAREGIFYNKIELRIVTNLKELGLTSKIKNEKSWKAVKIKCIRSTL